MIIIRLNDLKYRYEVYQMFNLFFLLDKIEFTNSDFQFDIHIDDDLIKCSNQKLNKEFKVVHGENFKEQIKKSIFIFLKEITEKNISWGIMTGIRPSKIALALLNKGFTENEIMDYYYNHYYTSKEKTRLCIEVAKEENKHIKSENKSISIYVGMPFCPTRCVYCSFASNPISSCKDIVEPYLNALKYEIEFIGEYVKAKNLNIQCVYFGGGTPTAIDNAQFEKVMACIYSNIIQGSNIEEFTVECGRPDSITAEKLNTMKQYKVDRISINPQTMNDDTLKSIGRNHTTSDIIEKYELARSMGFDNINMDIIIGLPNESEKHIKTTCTEIMKLNPDNITVHGMSIKRASRLYENLINGDNLAKENQNFINNAYIDIDNMARSLGMKPYYMYRQKNMVGNGENVGYCKEHKTGIYNIQMIEEQQTIIAMGADGVTKVVFPEENRIERYANVKDVREYISRIDEMLNNKKKLLDTLFSK